MSAYDRWLEEPYQRAAAQQDQYERAIDELGLEAPHRVGDRCPRCGDDAGLEAIDPAEYAPDPVPAGLVVCPNCGDEVSENEDVTFDVFEWIRDEIEGAAEAAAEARAEARADMGW